MYNVLSLFGGKVKVISDTQRYMALGNSWTKDAIVKILKGSRLIK